jgi:hypothetical protein
MGAPHSARGGEILFSILEPGTHLRPHCGPSNNRLTVHLGLMIPPGCTIRVAGETREWEVHSTPSLLETSDTTSLERRKHGEKVANRNGVSGGTHATVSRRPPISLHTIVPRTGGYAHDVGVWDLSIVQGPFSVAPCQT